MSLVGKENIDAYISWAMGNLCPTLYFARGFRHYWHSLISRSDAARMLT